MKINVLVDKMENIVGCSQVGIVKANDKTEIELGIIAGPEQSIHEIEIDDNLMNCESNKIQQIARSKLDNLPGQTLKKLKNENRRANLQDKKSQPPLIGVHSQRLDKMSMDAAELEALSTGCYQTLYITMDLSLILLNYTYFLLGTGAA